MKGKDAKQDAKKDDRSERVVPTSGAAMRFNGLDKNNDGVVTRAEWNGSNTSFANHDWNRDGVLSGNEVRPGARPPANAAAAPARPPAKPAAAPVGTAGRDPDEAEFRQLDLNRDGVLSQGEWRGSGDTFNRIDFNHDGVLNPYEYGVGR